MDESMITGESSPVAKAQGDPVCGGTANQHGSVLMLAERVGEETMLAQVCARTAVSGPVRAPAGDEGGGGGRPSQATMRLFVVACSLSFFCFDFPSLFFFPSKFTSFFEAFILDSYHDCQHCIVSASV